MSVDRLEQLFATYLEDGYAPVPTDLLDWAIDHIEGLETDNRDLRSQADRTESTIDEQLEEQSGSFDTALSKYCYELLGTHNPTPLDLRGHPALQRLLDAVR